MLLNTARIPFVSLRDAVASDDTAITVFKRSNWPTVTANNGPIKLKDPPLHDANGLIISAFGTDTADDVLTSYKLLGVARQNGPIYTLLTGVMTLGTTVATTHPITSAAVTSGLWVDTITVTGGLFSGMVEILDSGNNRIAGLKFDQTFIDEIYMEIDLSTINAFYAILTGY